MGKVCFLIIISVFDSIITSVLVCVNISKSKMVSLLGYYLSRDTLTNFLITGEHSIIFYNSNISTSYSRYLLAIYTYIWLCKIARIVCEWEERNNKQVHRLSKRQHFKMIVSATKINHPPFNIWTRETQSSSNNESSARAWQ